MQMGGCVSLTNLCIAILEIVFSNLVIRLRVCLQTWILLGVQLCNAFSSRNWSLEISARGTREVGSGLIMPAAKEALAIASEWWAMMAAWTSSICMSIRGIHLDHRLDIELCWQRDWVSRLVWEGFALNRFRIGANKNGMRISISIQLSIIW